MPPENLLNDTSKNSKKPIVFIVVIVCIAVVVYFLSQIFPFGGLNNEMPPEKVSVQRFDSGPDRGTSEVPAGLPQGLPIEDSAEILESYSAVYEERGVIQHSLSYVSQNSTEDIFESFLNFVEDGGYEISYDGRDSGSLVISADKDNNNLFFSVSIREGRVFVQISYLER